MGRGRSTSGGSRGRMVSSGSRGGMSSGGGRGVRHGGSRTTVIIGGGYGPRHRGHGRPSKTGNIIAAIIFLMFGAVLFTALISSIIDANSYASVTGTVVKNEYVGGGYYTTYEYTVKGEEYVNRSQQSWEFPEDDEYATIYYEKDNPNNIVEEKPELGFGNVIVGIVAVVMTATGVILLVQGIRMKRENETETYGGDSSSSSETKPETHTTCSYCGSRYKSDLSACPRCGAGK